MFCIRSNYFLTTILFSFSLCVISLASTKEPTNVLAMLGKKFKQSSILPVVINTWPFRNATEKAWEVVYKLNGTALDAIEKGCSLCEIEQCDGSVGYGGSPNEDGETTLDAMIMDGPTHRSGSVAGIRRVKNAIGVARKVMEKTEHTLLVGEWATQFAIQMGFHEENLTTPESEDIWKEWQDEKCQPNFWKDVYPDPRENCGPYSLIPEKRNKDFEYSSNEIPKGEKIGHDTIGMVIIDSFGNIASGTSTNGARHKIPGRIGDSPITGSGSYVDQEVGGAAATGDGDVLMRFLPSLVAVEYMRNGLTPKIAADYSLQRIAKRYPEFSGAVVALNIDGAFGAACYGFKNFSFSVVNPDLQTTHVYSVDCNLASSGLRNELTFLVLLIALLIPIFLIVY